MFVEDCDNNDTFESAIIAEILFFKVLLRAETNLLFLFLDICGPKLKKGILIFFGLKITKFFTHQKKLYYFPL